jgi:hypothetical protein|tara:strand:+ start:3139 stop:3378 length:240 start_codon:yes stop_codon:yes gene_type:complete
MNPFNKAERSEGHSRRIQRQKTDVDLEKKAGYRHAPQKILGARVEGTSTHNQSIARQHDTFDPLRSKQEQKEVSHHQPH